MAMSGVEIEWARGVTGWHLVFRTDWLAVGGIEVKFSVCENVSAHSHGPGGWHWDAVVVTKSQSLDMSSGTIYRVLGAYEDEEAALKACESYARLLSDGVDALQAAAEVRPMSCVQRMLAAEAARASRESAVAEIEVGSETSVAESDTDAPDEVEPVPVAPTS